MSKRFAFILVLVLMAALLMSFGHRIAVSASEFWARIHPTAAQPGGVTIETDRGTYEVLNAIPARAPIDTADLNDNTARVRALMARMPTFNQVMMLPGIRWFRYRPDWYLDEAMETTSGQVWVTYWPKTEASRAPEYFGQLYGGTLRHFMLPREPYYTLVLDYFTGPTPFVRGMQLETGKWFYWAVLPNGSVADSSSVPASLRGTSKRAVCKQGSPASSTALYGLLQDGRWQPILSWRSWQAATLGIWRYDANYPLECAGRFAGYFWVFYESAGQGALYRVSNGTIVPFTAGRPYIVTDRVMILYDGDQIIEAHSAIAPSVGLFRR